MVQPSPTTKHAKEAFARSDATDTTCASDVRAHVHAPNEVLVSLASSSMSVSRLWVLEGLVFWDMTYPYHILRLSMWYVQWTACSGENTTHPFARSVSLQVVHVSRTGTSSPLGGNHRPSLHDRQCTGSLHDRYGCFY